MKSNREDVASNVDTASDAQKFRKVIDRWFVATKAGDITPILSLMTEDVVFLAPGKPPMHREDFISTFNSSAATIEIDARFDVQEIAVCGDIALCWNMLDVKMAPLVDGETTRRTGPTLTALRRGADGQWRLWRDANILAPASRRT